MTQNVWTNSINAKSCSRIIVLLSNSYIILTTPKMIQSISSSKKQCNLSTQVSSHSLMCLSSMLHIFINIIYFHYFLCNLDMVLISTSLKLKVKNKTNLFTKNKENSFIYEYLSLKYSYTTTP
jgi:hypothetical protein